MTEIAVWIGAAGLFVLFTYEIIRKLNQARRETRPLPFCWGDMPPNPQHQAEYDCMHCQDQASCWMRTTQRRGPGVPPPGEPEQ